LGINPSKLTAQNVVDLAYGAADMELNKPEAAPGYGGAMYSIAVDDSFAAFKKSRMMVELGNLWGRAKPSMLTAHQLVDQFKDRLPALAERAKTINLMDKLQNEIVQASHKVAMQWQALKKSERTALHQVMMDATLWRIHPDKPLTDEANRHLGENSMGGYADLKARYDALPSSSKDVYVAARDALATNWELRRKIFDEVTVGAYAKRIAEAATPADAERLTAERDKLVKDHTKQIEEMRGPYFPLMRFGDYLTISMSKKMADLQAQLDAASGETHAALTKQIDTLKKDKAHYVVSAFENRTDAERARDQMEARGMVSKAQLAEQHLQQNRNIQNVEQLTHAMTQGMDVKNAREIKERIAYLYIAGMPEHAALQRQLSRVGVEGATTDMLRAFAEAGKTDSFFLSRMKYAGDITDQLFRIKADAKKSKDVDLQRVPQVLERHVELDMTFDDTPIQNAINRLSGVWHLAMSPAYLLTNASQPWFISAPIIASRYGVNKAISAMWTGWVDAKNAIVMSKKAGWMADFDITKLPKDAQGVVQHVADNGQLDINILMDMGLISGETNPAFAKAQQAINLPNSVIELSNRVSTAIAAYRLAVGAGLSDEKAKAYALDVVVSTHLDYGNSSAALLMRQNGLIKHAPIKMMMQFRKYQQGMIYLVAELAHQSKASPEARRALGYLFAMQGVFAGAAGIPLVMTPLAIVSLFTGGDDEEGDVETQLRNYLTDLMGADAARAFWKGLPAAMGLDISKRVGMGQLFDPLPFTRIKDVENAKTGQDAFGKIAVSVLGAGVGTLASMLDSTKMFAQGDYAKGFEKMLPKALADLGKAYRYSEEGMTTRIGNEVIPADKFTVADLALRAAGFSPTRESEHYEAQQSKEDTNQAIKKRRTQVIRDAVEARQNKDAATVRRLISEFNADHPSKEYRITMSTLLRSAQAKRQRKVDEAGVAWTKSERALRGIDRYAL
jgi:hypothetical protein